MLRIWLCLSVLFLSSVGGSGFMSAASVEVCSRSCPDDDEHGQCAPDCADCLCCAHVRPVVLARTSIVLLSLREAVLIEHEVSEPPSVEVGDILHVPIAPLA